jgi:2-octaprenylphenol hydroxylase
VTINTLKEETDYIELTTHTEKTIKTKLLIAADGAGSRVRTHAKFELSDYDYEHTAIVATVTTEQPHQYTARQRFLPTGPLAFLPLDDPHHCSMVWSAEHAYAKKLLSFDDQSFCEILRAEFANKLGDMIAITSRHSFPLRMRHVKNYVRSRLALVGDAAHTIHPMAGQGVNLGLLDAVALAEVVIDAHKKNRDFASLATLRRYERWRKSDTLAMLALVESLKRLFSSHQKPVQSIRNLGLTLTNHSAFVKKKLIQYATGKRGDLPVLAKLAIAHL